MKRRTNVTQKRLKELLHYDPETGIFRWTYRDNRWRRVGGTAGTNKTGYLVIYIDGLQYGAHRLAVLYMTGRFPPDEVDHKNGKRSDNRWENLRECTHGFNGQNLRKANSRSETGLIGAHPNSRNSYMARIQVGGKQLYLGNFKTAQEANAAYVSAKRRLHPGCTI